MLSQITQEGATNEKTKAKRMLEKAREHVGDSLFTLYDFDKVKLRKFLKLYSLRHLR